MKFYISQESDKFFKKYTCTNKLYVLSIPNLINNLGYNLDNIDKFGTIFISDTIEDLIEKNLNNKKINGLLYLNPNLNTSTITNLINFIQDFDYTTEIILLDNNQKSLCHLYSQFQNIIYFQENEKTIL